MNSMFCYYDKPVGKSRFHAVKLFPLTWKFAHPNSMKRLLLTCEGKMATMLIYERKKLYFSLAILAANKKPPQ